MGQLVDHRYRIEQKLAVGGFGSIYSATDTTIGRKVALKILHRELAGDANVVARFHRETAALAKLRSPNTLTMYDVGETDDTLYFVMELLRGESLYDLFERTGPLAWRRMSRIARGVCNSLREAHGLGIVHRDLKPANIFLERHALDVDLVKVLDFGIAKILASSELPNRDLTRHGQMIGTFDYMAPEQMVGGACTGKSDLFTLGVVMYEMLTGARPFGEAAGPAQVLMALMTLTPTPLTGVPSELSRIVMKCLSREPQDRPDVEQLDTALARVLEIDEAAFSDADEPTLINAQAPRPSRPLSPPHGTAIPAPLRAATPRPTLPRGSAQALHVAPELAREDARVNGLPSVLIARDALETTPFARSPQGTPLAGAPVAPPNARTMMAPGAQAAQAVAAATGRSAQQIGLAPTLDVRTSTLPTPLMARGSDLALAGFQARGSEVEIASRDSHRDIGVRCSEAAIARDIELALAATVSSEASPEAFLAQGSDVITRLPQTTAPPSLTRVPRVADVAVRFAPSQPVPTPKSRLAAGTSPIENETDASVALARRAITLPAAPESSALAVVRFATIAACLFGLGFLVALAIWSL